MKTTLKIVGAYSFTYLLISFVLWDLNPANWDMGTRFYSSVFATLLALVTILGEKNDNIHHRG